MINGNLDQFLDTGWFTEATLFYHGHIYWLEAQNHKTEKIFVVDRWEAVNEDNLYYHSVMEKDGTLIWERVLEIHEDDMEQIKQQFLESPVFDGKTFWQIEKEVVWLDESNPITR